jgi:4-amino-4-deoxy-L-arabinose transferase-like glycosyltransferase
MTEAAAEQAGPTGDATRDGRLQRFVAWSTTRPLRGALLVLALSMLVRLVFALRSDLGSLEAAIPDAGTYLGPARNLLARGAFLAADGHAEIQRVPGYPAFAAVLIGAFGPRMQAVLVAQSILLSFTAPLLFWLGLRVAGPRPALFAATIAALSPWSASLASQPLSDGLFLLLLVALFLAAEAAERRGHAALGLAVGLLAAAAILVRPVPPLVALMFVALAVVARLRGHARAAFLVAFLVAAIAPLGVWRARNAAVGGFDGLSNISGKTATRYLVARIEAVRTHGDRALISHQIMTEERASDLSPNELDAACWRRVRAEVRAHPLLAAYVVALSATEHAVHPSPEVLAGARLGFPGARFVLAGVWGSLLVLALAGAWLVARRPPAGVDRAYVLAVALVCAALTAASGISFGAGSRLRMPLEIAVALLAGIALDEGLRRLAARAAKR